MKIYHSDDITIFLDSKDIEDLLEGKEVFLYDKTYIRGTKNLIENWELINKNLIDKNLSDLQALVKRGLTFLK